MRYNKEEQETVNPKGNSGDLYFIVLFLMYAKGEKFMSKARMKTLEQVKQFAEKQMETGNIEVYFDFHGASIVNPWKDATSRFDFTDEQAIKYYGENNYNKFIERAEKQLNEHRVMMELYR